jgi:FkbM family methyltransferase
MNRALGANAERSDGAVEKKKTLPVHHQVFGRFRRWEGKVPEGFVVNFLGVMRRIYFWQPDVNNPPAYPADRYVKTDYPALENLYLEWIAVLEAVLAAEGQFIMMELGAGYGYWTANAAAALKQTTNLPYSFVAVEADPTHFQWMMQHFKDNGIDAQSVRAIQAAVTATDGKVGFQAGNKPTGMDLLDQAIGGSHMVEAVSLASLLKPLTMVDLIHVDIQGAELEVLRAGAQELDEKVKCVCVGTHSRQIEEGLRSLFQSLGWKPVRDIACFSSTETEWGLISCDDGVQCWVNPSYPERQTDNVEALRQKLQASRQEAARLWSELEKTRATSLIPESLGWRLMRRARGLRELLAPGGSRRRKVFEYLSRKI